MRRPKRSRSRARFERELQAAQVLNSADSSPENERATPTLTFVRPGSGGPGESVCLYVRAYIYIILARTRSPKRICTVYTRTQVEKIVGFRNIRGVPHYKVHWQSYSRDQDSWEPAKNLAACSVLLDEYHARKAAASPPKVRGGGWAAGLEVLIGHLCAVVHIYISTSQDTCYGCYCCLSTNEIQYVHLLIVVLHVFSDQAYHPSFGCHWEVLGRAVARR